MSSMFCTKIYNCKNADWCARDFNPKAEKPKCFEQLTHYDRVHAMNEEEFAQWLCDVAGWLPTFEGRVHPILEWLRQEAIE